MTTGWSWPPSQYVIPTEDPKGPSGGIARSNSTPQIPPLASLGRDDNEVAARAEWVNGKSEIRNPK